MCDLPKFSSEALLVGFEASDDAAVYKLNKEQAIIQTLDFFTPIVDDPYDFGAIAATNALSDVYAMGGKPVLAMNIVGFPNCLDYTILKEIMRGGADKVKEAGALLVGGHSIEDNEPKYGLSVMGIVAPEKVWRNSGAKPGDLLILTKPLGMGILTTALKESMLDDDVRVSITKVMTTLNKIPVDLIEAHDILVNACTDVTGFGLLGHALEMANGSKVSLIIKASAVPMLNEAISLAEMGIIPGGTYKNMKHASPHVERLGDIDEAVMDVLYDPQTSGGLLLSIPHEDAYRLMKELSTHYTLQFSIIGKVIERDSAAIYVEK